ncbi:hypothetical protein [Lyngbya confervoides]|uniref:Uncharacterized protein n=1 Tax=Lyngbya confervoides BDU141951 TaxID=1574623 RepID=A0ABD4T7R7_9CYAN|nr:hypothetical protein [Lyngbya confervoides]MCM1984485.1 hypothetical protein [Lyngbya confervoides BDU141951]
MSAKSVIDQARDLFIRKIRRIRRREQAMLARTDEEIGLTAQDAARYESSIQGKIPHDFSVAYDRSKSAMS